MNKNETLIDLLGVENETIQLSDSILAHLNLNVGVMQPEVQPLDHSFLDTSETISLS